MSSLAIMLVQEIHNSSAENQMEEMDKNLQEMLDLYETSSFFGTDEEDIKDYLHSKNDLSCYEEEVCCGGNSVGFYTCFYPDDTK